MSAPGRSMFPKGPTFTLETFSNKDFITKDFVESLSDTAAPSNRRSIPTQQAFDPKPLIRSFEAALSQLSGLSEQLEEKESEIATTVRRAELQHDQTLETLGRKLDQSINAFESLDISLNQSNGTNGNSRSRADDGGNVAVQIGENLEELDKQTRRALDAKFLIQCWLELTETGDLTSLQEVRIQGGGEGKVRCAVIARQLMKISQRLDPASWSQTNGRKVNGATNGVTDHKGHNTRQIIEKFSESLEQDLLIQFDGSYRKQNYDDAMECARVLHDFNGGSSAVALFVNQHQFFIDRSQLITEEVTTNDDTWEKLADPDADPPGVEQSLQSLVDEIRVVMQEESFIMKRAFPYYEIVLTKFIQRVFQQSIQQRLEMVLEKAETISSLAFLRSLHASRTYIHGLVEDLKIHGLTEHPDPCSAQTGLILDQQLEELFVPYLVGSSYIDRERRSLEELYSSLLFKFTIYHSRRKKVSTGFMASLAQQGTQLLSSAKDAYIDRLDSSELTPTQKTMMLRVAGLRDAENNANKNEIEVSEEDGVLSIDNAMRMLKWLAEGVRRSLELSGGGSETPKDVAALLNLLLMSMGQVYVETALDSAADQAVAQEFSKTEPEVSYLPSLQASTAITNLMSRFINTVLIRLADSNTTVRREMDKQSEQAIRRMEGKASGIIQKTVDVATNWVIRLLANQKKGDFRPKEDSGRGPGYLESLSTPTCEAVVAFLIRISGVARRALAGPNLERFNNELALSVRDLLFEHFKKFQVNATGGLMVTKDISKYVSTLKDWSLNKDVDKSLEILSEIGNFFIIGPEALRERSRTLQASGLGKGLDKSDFRAFVMRRDDAGTIGVQSVLVGL